MKKQLFFLLILFIISLNLYATDGIALEGTLVLKDNTTISIEGFTQYNDLKEYYISCKYNNTDIEIQLDKIYRIDVLSGSIDYNDNKVSIKLRDDKIFEVVNAQISFGYHIDRGRTKCLYYRTYDVINNEVIKNKINCNQIKSIIFDKIGDISVDPSTGQKFPPDYRYNPYTGKRLEPGTFGNP